MAVTYNPAIFDVDDLDQAKRIILTPEGSTTEERWETETPYLARLIGKAADIGPASVVLDFGCGIGRIAKALIDDYGCRIVGMDISRQMLEMAPGFVGSDRFEVCSPGELASMVAEGRRFDAALAIWVLQHGFKPQDDIDLLHRALKEGGHLFVLNNIHRAVPTKEKPWANDGVDVGKLLRERFPGIEVGTLPSEKIARGMVGGHFWGQFQKRTVEQVVSAAEPASGAEPVVSSATKAESSVTSSSKSDTKAPFRSAATIPTQSGPQGIRYDFNDGARVTLPDVGRPWRVRLSDIDTGNILYETKIGAGVVRTAKRYYVRARIEVWDGEERVLRHDYDATDREVMIQLPVGTLGDSIGWFPYAARFGQAHGCRLTCVVAERMIPLFQGAYPEIEFVTMEAAEPERYYATYNIGLFFDDEAHVHQPCDFRHVGLHRTAGYILGVDPTEAPPKLATPDTGRPIPERYVCIAAQSTTQAKYWNNPSGWRDIVQFLKDQGYRVICIDQKPVHGHGIVWNHIPWGAEDQTGERPLDERINWLRHAEFFVGLSSGLAWLAWASGTPVVMISGFTHPTNEFDTPYRVINYHACNSCWNDVRLRFDHKDFLWCPRHAGTSRQFECTRLITAEAVKTAIRKVMEQKAGEQAA